jgi:TolB-like protein/Flp pilus assembly protein TadD
MSGSDLSSVMVPPLAVTPRVFDVLVTLVRSSGRMVPRKELIDLVWTGVFVEEQSLTRTISGLRRVLGDARGENRFIETVSKSGYRSVAPVRPHGSADAGASLAILPFSTIGVSEEQQYLGIGIADSLITQLSQVRELAVRPTSSVLRFGGGCHDAVATGRDLRVDWVLDGRIQADGDILRISIQLINVTSSNAFWAASFKEGPARLLELQDQIAARIVAAIVPQLGASGFRTRRFTLSPDAHLHYLRGVHHLYKFSENSFGKAIAELSAAIDCDPTYALPHSALAMTYLIGGDSFMHPREAWHYSAAHVIKALEADPVLGDARSIRGAIRFWFGYEREASEDDLRKGIELGPSSPLAHAAFGWYLTAMGRFPEAERTLARALELDPTSIPINTDQSLPLFFSGRFPESVDRLLQALEMEPHHWYAHAWLGLARLECGDYEGALRSLEAALELSGGEVVIRALLALALVRGGRRDEGKRVANDLESVPVVPAYDLAAVRLALGERDEAIRLLRLACEFRSKWVGWILVDPRFASLRGDPHFKRVIRSAGF